MMPVKTVVFVESWAQTRCLPGFAFSSSTTGKIENYPDVCALREALAKEVEV